MSNTRNKINKFLFGRIIKKIFEFSKITQTSMFFIFLLFYLLIYILFYMIDDLVVFILSMITLEATGITNKYNKLCTLVSAIIMILMGALLILKPNWLMLNF